VIFKMNAVELGILAALPGLVGLKQIQDTALELAAKNRRAVIVTLAERGIVAAQPDGTLVHVPAFPLRGQIDVVGAGDAVTANAAAALAAGATLAETIELAAAGASIVLHQLGTTGSASVSQLHELMFPGKNAFTGSGASARPASPNLADSMGA
jgi:sugar/nucleoside kinase (ribokinase family)